MKEGVEYELELWRDLLVDFMEVRRGGRKGGLLSVNEGSALEKSWDVRAKRSLVAFNSISILFSPMHPFFLPFPFLLPRRKWNDAAPPLLRLVGPWAATASAAC